jgi:hypothetical protein
LSVISLFKKIRFSISSAAYFNPASFLFSQI